MSQSTHGFSVPFRFPVYFPQDAWCGDKLDFLGAVRREQPNRREAANNDFAQPLAIVKRINNVGLDRRSILAVIGGGAVLDMVSRYTGRGYDRHFLPGPTRQVLAGPVITW